MRSVPAMVSESIRPLGRQISRPSQSARAAAPRHQRSRRRRSAVDQSQLIIRNVAFDPVGEVRLSPLHSAAGARAVALAVLFPAWTQPRSRSCANYGSELNSNVLLLKLMLRVGVLISLRTHGI